MPLLLGIRAWSFTYVHISVCPSWFPHSNLSSPCTNHLTFLHKVSQFTIMDFSTCSVLDLCPCLVLLLCDTVRQFSLCACFPPPIKLTAMRQYNWNIVESGIKHHIPNFQMCIFLFSFKLILHFSKFPKLLILNTLANSEGLCTIYGNKDFSPF